MNRAGLHVVRFLSGLASGVAGLITGAFLGAAAGRFITGEQGLHGFDEITLGCMGFGAIVGLFVGAKAGSAVAAKLLYRGSDVDVSDPIASSKGSGHET